MRPVAVEDVADLAAFLGLVDLTTSGLDAATVRLWIDRDAGGRSSARRATS